jgi:hypothetical protein
MGVALLIASTPALLGRNGQVAGGRDTVYGSEGWEFESLRARQRVGSPVWFIIQSVQCH